VIWCPATPNLLSLNPILLCFLLAIQVEVVRYVARLSVYLSYLITKLFAGFFVQEPLGERLILPRNEYIDLFRFTGGNNTTGGGSPCVT